MFVNGALQRERMPSESRTASHLISTTLTVLLCLLSLSAPAAAKAKFSAISVDARTGNVLFAADADGLRHPASLTKVMTLYLLFQDMKAGKLRLGSPIRISARAASMAPSKLGVKPGTSITVETAIKAIAVKSANDVASAIGENLAGTEQAFAARMTKTARALGMSRTVFRNASGLPNPGQVTTARDMATLSLRIQRDFPQYYPYFRTMAFTYKGRTIRTHNRLLGRYKGTDGIKTGYIAASGFNLTTSALRDGKRVVGVVMGGRSGASRNAYMMKMLDQAFPRCSAGRTIAAKAGSSKGIIDPLANLAAAVKPAQPKKTPKPAEPEIAEIEADPQDGVGDSNADSGEDGEAADAIQADGSTIETVVAAEQPGGPEVIEARIEPPVLPDLLPFEVKPEAEQPVEDAAAVASLPADAWHIQIGAYPNKKDAQLRLQKLRANGPGGLRDKPAFTVTVQKGDETTYRARFSGFSEKSARETCQAIMRKNMACYVVAPNS
jgi:D-alanyl-D-alanine carboxypeptidase